MEEDPPALIATTGVSRSGRIRKKSSKLRDYQSDDLDGHGSGGVGGSPSKRAKGQDIPQPPTDDEDRMGESPNARAGHNLSSSGRRVPNRSIYMSEKSTAKNRVFLQDGSVQVKRQPRKDKGRTRMTAYMLWARSVRGQMDELDFASKSQRLGELWANVSTNERLLWKRRVTTYNRTQAKHAAKAALEKAKGTASVQSATTNNNNNKSRNSRTGGSIRDGEIRKSSNTSKRPQFNPTEATDPINLAAHLKLLGDSLTNIGESLTQHEHKGNNSITGAVSVLLDSLLCSLVPLLSLTTQIDGFGHRVVHLKDTFQATLDNIAYVMPGLPF